MRRGPSGTNGETTVDGRNSRRTGRNCGCRRADAESASRNGGRLGTDGNSIIRLLCALRSTKPNTLWGFFALVLQCGLAAKNKSDGGGDEAVCEMRKAMHCCGLRGHDATSLHESQRGVELAQPESGRRPSALAAIFPVLVLLPTRIPRTLAEDDSKERG